MRINEFDVYADLLKEKSGLTLTPDKSYMIESRLSPVATQWGFATLEAMTVALNGIPDPALIKDVVEAMMTHETSFFRDFTPFEVLQDKVLPALIKERKDQKALRIWCAGCASGQEPYSIAMILSEMQKKLKGWHIDILATDIDHRILEDGERGVYTQSDVQYGLPVRRLLDCFDQTDKNWVIRDDVRAPVRFQYFNLLDSMAPLGEFDIIFCRNVLLYFDKKTRAKTLQRLQAQLAPGGFLCLGRDEEAEGFAQTKTYAPFYRPG